MQNAAAPDVCPLCSKPDCSTHHRSEGNYIECKHCGHFVIDRISLIMGQRGEFNDVPLHLVRAYVSEKPTDRAESTRIIGQHSFDEILKRCPQRIEQKAHKLLARLISQSAHFGALLKISNPSLVLCAYAVNIDEAKSLLSYLNELGYVSDIQPNLDSVQLSVRAAGYEAIERRKLLTPLTAFISSTCYDLIDLRAEIATALEQVGCVVRMSEDPERFAVDPLADSIESCLRNVDSSDIIICIADRRYGGVIDAGPYKGKSATQVEVEYARSQKKPILFYMRDRAWNDFSVLRRDAAAKTLWIEPHHEVNRALWRSFMLDVAAIPEHRDKSNWVTLFKTSADLRRLVLKQIADYSPAGK